MLKLAKTELRPMTEQRIIRMMKDAVIMQTVPMEEVRAAYDALEAVRDALSHILDRADGEHV